VFGFLVVMLGGWWFTLAVGVIVQIGLLEFLRMARFKWIRQASRTQGFRRALQQGCLILENHHWRPAAQIGHGAMHAAHG
jgi:hypothetical protein